VILVFMRSLKTRPGLRERFGRAFHAETLAPFLNMLLREDEIRGIRALTSAPESELPKSRSPLNWEEKTGNYGLSTVDNIMRYHHAKGRVGNTVTEGEAAVAAGATTPSTVTHARDEDTGTAGRMYTDTLPEGGQLQGLFFAGEADAPCGGHPADSAGNAEANAATA